MAKPWSKSVLSSSDDIKSVILSRKREFKTEIRRLPTLAFPFAVSPRSSGMTGRLFSGTNFDFLMKHQYNKNVNLEVFYKNE